MPQEFLGVKLCVFYTRCILRRAGKFCVLILSVDELLPCLKNLKE
jgi:hypothetical protein